MITRTLPLHLACLLSVSIPLQASEVIDFEGVQAAEGYYLGFSFSSNGFDFTAESTNDSAAFTGYTGSPVGNGTRFSSNGTVIVRMGLDGTGGNSGAFSFQRSDGRPFSLLSLDFAEQSKVGDFAFEMNATSILVEGLHRSTVIASTTLTLDLLSDGPGGNPDFQTAAFGPEFSNASLDSVRLTLFSTLGAGGPLDGIFEEVAAAFFDNIVTMTIEEGVPASLDSGRLIGVDKVEIETINPRTGALSDATLYDPRIQPFPDAVNAQTYHPAEGLFYLLETEVDRGPLITFDATTGQTARACSLDIDGNSGASIEFGAAADGYPLYLIRGGGSASFSGDINLVDIHTGEVTETGWATSGVGGHAIAFHPGDGDLYHFYNTDDSGGGSPGLEKIDPDTGAVTPIALTGTVHGVCNGVAYLNGNFYVVQNSTRALYSVTPAGVVTLLGTLPDRVKSLAADGSSLYTIGPESSLQEIDLSNVGTYNSSVAVTNGVPDLWFQTEGLARDPTTGILYLASSRIFPEDLSRDALYELDPLTGRLRNPIPLSIDGLTGFAFLPDGTLYAVTGDLDASSPGTPANGTICTVSLIDGTVTPVSWAASAIAAEEDQVIAYRSVDGLLYRCFQRAGEVFMETIHLASGARTQAASVPWSGGFFTCLDMVYDPGEDLFYLSLGPGGVYSLTPTGTLSLVAQPIINERFRGLEIEPDLELTDFSVGTTATLDFKSVTNREYGLYSTTDLVQWDPVPGFECIPATPPLNSATGVPLPATERGFFRLGPPAGK